MRNLFVIRMLGKNPSSVQKRICDFHAEKSKCALVNLVNRLKQAQIGHGHDDGCEVMHYDAWFKHVLAP